MPSFLQFFKWLQFQIILQVLLKFYQKQVFYIQKIQKWQNREAQFQKGQMATLLKRLSRISIKNIFHTKTFILWPER